MTDTLQAEVDSWVLDDPDKQREKLRRERVRHYGLVKALLLDKLDTETFDVLEVGGGPLPLSDVLEFRSRVVVDPLSDSYRKIAHCPDHVTMTGEDMSFRSKFDLAICTNALDHVQDPERVSRNIQTALRPGGYAALACATWNAITHPHEAHAHNLDAKLVYSWFARDFELCWRLTYEDDGFRYGHVLFNERRGQPAWTLLLRKCSGYPS